jgi:DNA (cytosine-5)-methyltransferase 1
VPKWRDIHELKGDDIIQRVGRPTLISGGFPCQPHSLAGKRQASGDERDLSGELLRIIREVKPRWFIGENVSGIRSSESGRFFGKFLYDISKMGYTVGWGSWGAVDVGACHRRERVFIVAHSNDAGDRAPGNETIRNREKDMREGWEYPFDRTGRPNSDVAHIEHMRRDNGTAQRQGVCGNKTRNETGTSDKSVANTDKQGSQRHWEEYKLSKDFKEIKIGRKDLVTSNSYNTKTARQREDVRAVHSLAKPEGSYLCAWQEPWPEVATRLCRVDDGVSNRVDRLTSLGNAVVPQQVYPILKAIAEVEHHD